MCSRSKAFVYLLLALIFAASAAAQSFRGSIQGQITDPTGASIAGAQVKVSSPGTGLSRTVITNDLGSYVASELPLGSYSITVAKEGFRTITLNNIPVSVGSASRADAQLTTGAIEERVEVNAEIPLVETATNTTGGTIEASEAAELPINGRDFTKLLELVPGATSDPVGSTESAGAYGLFSLNGNRGRSNNYLLDGTDMNDGYRNLPAVNQAGVWGAPSTILPVDALAEIPVTGSPEAEFGRSAGATINIVTKSGTNQFHGAFNESFRNADLAARNYFNTADMSKNQFTNHQFSGLIDGPIVHDATFFTLSYEGQREFGHLPQLGSVPNQAYVDAATSINPVMKKLLDAKPWGTLPTGTSTSPYSSETFTTPFRNNSDNVIVKADQHLHLLSSGDILTGRYFYAHGKQNFPLGMQNTGNSAVGFNTITPTHVNVASLSYTTVPRSDLIVELRGGYNRFLQQFLPEDMGLNPNTTYGLNTLSPDTTARDTGLPTITVTGLSSLGANSSDSRGRIDTNYQYLANVSLLKGRHSLKAGAEGRRTFINSFINAGHRGKLAFSSFDDFLSGSVHSGSSADGPGTRYSYQNGAGVYLMDSWKATAKLSIDLGLRWDYFGVVGAQGHAFSLFDPTLVSLKTVGSNDGGPQTLYPRSFTDFSPRVSVVDDLMGNGKIVLRTSGGIYYDGPSQDFFVGNYAYNTYAAQQGPAFNNIGFSFIGNTTIQAGKSLFGDATAYTPNSIFTVDQNLVTPRYYSYNLNLESQLTKKIALQLGYVGSQGRHLFRFRDINQFNNLTGTTQSCDDGSKISYGSQCFPSYLFGTYAGDAIYYINQIETEASSSYNSAQATLKIQGLHGLNSTLNYTWAHSIDTASDGQDFVPNAAQPDNSFNPHAERASSNFDVRQRIQWYWSYNLPKFNTLKLLTNGWALDGMFNFASGQPYTVHYLFEDDYNGSGEYFGRFDMVGDAHKGAKGYNLLALDSFAAPCTFDSTSGSCVDGSKHPGSEGRNAFTSPSYTNFDLSLTKTTTLYKGYSLEIRADVFNVLNHPNFSNPLLPGFGIDAFGGGSHTSGDKLLAGASSGQYLQTTATPDVGSGNPFLGGGGPRSAQLALHLTF